MVSKPNWVLEKAGDYFTFAWQIFVIVCTYSFESENFNPSLAVICCNFHPKWKKNKEERKKTIYLVSIMKMVTFGSSLPSFYCCFFFFPEEISERERKSKKNQKLSCWWWKPSKLFFFLSSVFFFSFWTKVGTDDGKWRIQILRLKRISTYNNKYLSSKDDVITSFF